MTTFVSESSLFATRGEKMSRPNPVLDTAVIVGVLIAGSAGIGIIFGSVVVAVWLVIDLPWWAHARQNAR